MTDPVLEARWKAVLTDWGNDEAHGAFLEYCQKSDQLLEGAVRYRGMSGDRDRGPSADKRLAAISLLAVASLEATRSQPPTAIPAFSRLLLTLFFCASLVALLLLWRSF